LGMAALEPSHLFHDGIWAVPDSRVVSQQNRWRACRPIFSFRGSLDNHRATCLVAAGTRRAGHLAQTAGARMAFEYNVISRCGDDCNCLFGYRAPPDGSERRFGRIRGYGFVERSESVLRRISKGAQSHFHESGREKGRCKFRLTHPQRRRLMRLLSSNMTLYRMSEFAAAKSAECIAFSAFVFFCDPAILRARASSS